MSIWDLFHSKRSKSTSNKSEADLTEEDNKTDLTIAHPIETDGDRVNQARLNGGYSDDTFENDITHPITPEDGRNLDVETSNKVIDRLDISRPIVGDEDPVEFAIFTSITDPYGVVSDSDDDDNDSSDSDDDSDDDDSDNDDQGYGSDSDSDDDDDSDSNNDDDDNNNDDSDSDDDDNYDSDSDDDDNSSDSDDDDDDSYDD